MEKVWVGIVIHTSLAMMSYITMEVIRPFLMERYRAYAGVIHIRIRHVILIVVCFAIPYHKDREKKMQKMSKI